MSTSPTQKTKRLLLDYTMYTLHPVSTIKSILGRDIRVLSHESQSMVSSFDTIPVDVTYESPGSLERIYYLSKDDLKPISTGSSTYVGRIGDLLFRIDHPPTDLKKIPVRIYESLTTTSTGTSMTQVNYCATVVDTPLSSLITPLKYPGWVSSVGVGNQQVNQSADRQVNRSVSDRKELLENVEIYREGLKLFKHLPTADDIIVPDKLPGPDDFGTSAYVCSFWTLYPELQQRVGPVRGIIYAYDARSRPDVVLWFPTSNYIISPEELQNVADFIVTEQEAYDRYQAI